MVIFLVNIYWIMIETDIEGQSEFGFYLSFFPGSKIILTVKQKTLDQSFLMNTFYLLCRTNPFTKEVLSTT